MAGVSTKEIKNRIRSMESTKQITKAMEMVASSKLRQAQTQVYNSRPYFDILYNTVLDIASGGVECNSVYLKQKTVGKPVYVVIAGDRGLAGGYNSNIIKSAAEHMRKDEADVLPVGKKAVEYFQSHGFNVVTQQYAEAVSMNVGDCFSVAKKLCQMYSSGEANAIYICYTKFVSALSQTPEILQALPLAAKKSVRNGADKDMLYEPDSDTVFDAIVPEYIGGILYGAVCESRAAEHAARRTAMDAATQNADEMIAELSLKYNQARQAAITQEITEIVAGS